MNRPRRPTPEPLDVDVVSVVAVGTALWFVAFLVLLPLRGWLADHGHQDWFWTSLAGWVLGLLGIALSRAQRAARARAAQAAQAAHAAQAEHAEHAEHAAQAEHAERSDRGDGRGAGEDAAARGDADGGPGRDGGTSRRGDGRTG